MSAVSLAEIAIKNAIGKLKMDAYRVQEAARDLRVDLIPLTAIHVSRLFSLPLHHREPFDRLLIATAIQEKAPLVGGDARFPLYRPEGLSVIWK